MDKEKEKKNADPRGAKVLGPLVKSQRSCIASSNE